MFRSEQPKLGLRDSAKKWSESAKAILLDSSDPGEHIKQPLPSAITYCTYPCPVSEASPEYRRCYVRLLIYSNNILVTDHRFDM